MRKAFALLFLIGCSDEVLVAEERCGAPCAIVDGAVVVNQEALDVTCRPGKSVCKDEALECPDYVPPTLEELCGEFDDDDCDPSTTEGNILIMPGWYNNTCDDTEVGVCKKSYMVCVDGELVCDNRYKAPEVCDTEFRDEDCDGLVNERDPDMSFTVPIFRYDGDMNTANVGACRAGVVRCIDGIQRYDGMVLPRAEECGNQIDDDCDGLTDEREGEVEPRSFALLIDYSGSMFDYIENVEQALCDWSITRPADYFGIGGFGVANSGNSFEYIEIIPFSPAAEACRAMSQNNPMSGGTEYAAKAGLLFLYDNTWPTSDRNIIIFSDEELQNFSATDEENFINMCTGDSIQLGVYTNFDVEYTYQNIVDGCNGWVEYLASQSRMINSLTSRFAGTCSEQ